MITKGRDKEGEGKMNIVLLNGQPITVADKCLVSIDRSAGGAGCRSKSIGGVPSNCIPTTGIVIGHQVPEVNVSIHPVYVKDFIMCRTFPEIILATDVQCCLNLPAEQATVIKK